MPSKKPTDHAVEQFCRFVHERHRVYLRRRDGQSKPWTNDPVLQQFRFTNVYRELDTVTQWIAQNWRDPNASHPELWFAMAVARLINWPDTLAELSFPGTWNAKAASKFMLVASKRAERKQKVFTSAYIINQAVTGGYGMKKADYLARVVFTDLWDNREFIRPRAGDTLASFHARLMTAYGMGSFLAAQVVADLKYANVFLRQAPDWHTWAASGPGSRRGLNIVLQQPITTPMKEAAWLALVNQLQNELNDNRVQEVLERPLHAQDVQNCLCEYSKYTRGSSRQRYEGAN